MNAISPIPQRVQTRPCALLTLLALLTLAALAGAAQPPASGDAAYPLSGAPYCAVYRWGAGNSTGGAAGNEAYARWLKRPVVWAEDFEPLERWDSIEGGGWQLGEWSGWKKARPGRRLILSVPLLPGAWDLSGPLQGEQAHVSVSLEAGARGDYDAHFQKLAQNLVRFGLADTILRLGWEFNGGWYAWRAAKNPAAFTAYWRRIVLAMRSVPGAAQLRFCWNPAMRYQQFAAETAWPGDSFVDLVGLDVYDDSWLPNTYPYPAGATGAQIAARQRLVWDKDTLNGDHGLKFWRDFARQHHKPFTLPEWGVFQRPEGHGGLDNAYFIEQIHAFISDPANGVYFHCYFDVQAGDGGHQLSPGINGTDATRFPLAAARFKALFQEEKDR